MSEYDPQGIDQHAPGAKNDGGKDRWDLLPLDIIEGAVRVLTKGADKYSEDGWKAVPNPKNRYFSAMMRHFRKMMKGEYWDSGPGGTGESHWACFLCNAIFLGFFYDQDPRENAVKIYSDTNPPNEI